MKYPILVHSQYLLQDTEGAGRHTGSPSAYVEYEPVDTTIEALFTSDGTINAPLGVRGGHAGAKSQQFIRRRNGQLEELDLCARVILEPGESIISICTGAGGYGKPVERDPERVARDVREGFVSMDRARTVYGVDVDASGKINHRKTKELRNMLSVRHQANELEMV